MYYTSIHHRNKFGPHLSYLKKTTYLLNVCIWVFTLVPQFNESISTRTQFWNKYFWL